MKPRTAGFVQGFLAAVVLVAGVTLGVWLWPDEGDAHASQPRTSAVRAALDQAVGQAAVVHACGTSGPGRFVCVADTGHGVVAYRVAVTNGGRCWTAEATDASWKKWQNQPAANKPGTVDYEYNGWLHDRADCDPAFKHAQELKAKQAKVEAKNCTSGYSVCIPPDVGDVDCGELREIGATNIGVTGDDPYGLDADGDGVGCES